MSCVVLRSKRDLGVVLGVVLGGEVGFVERIQYTVCWCPFTSIKPHTCKTHCYLRAWDLHLLSSNMFLIVNCLFWLRVKIAVTCIIDFKHAVRAVLKHLPGDFIRICKIISLHCKSAWLKWELGFWSVLQNNRVILSVVCKPVLTKYSFSLTRLLWNLDSQKTSLLFAELVICELT